MFSENEKKQKKHYDRIGEKYYFHYFDKYSLKYRKIFIYKYLFEGLNFENKKVLEAMCGGEGCVKYLLKKKAKVWALDISKKEIEKIENNFPFCKTSCGSIIKTKYKNNFFDIIIIIGGLHHLNPNIEKAVAEIYRILKPKGYFCFLEPHQDSLVNFIRRLWYKKDNLFEKNEKAIDLKKLKKILGNKFIFDKERYGGNFAYQFVLNSMIWRIPLSWKKYYAGLFMLIEKGLEIFRNKYFSCFVICQWRKK